MASFGAFAGTEYVPGQISLDDLVAPPYDVVSPAERAQLASRSEYNAIHVELPEDPGGGDPYRHAAALWRSWHEEGAVQLSSVPCLYVYEMSFTAEGGEQVTTTGVLGALGLDPCHSGEVLPHEQTIAKDKRDRLSLLRATRTNFSPIWVLSPSEGLGALCRDAARAAGERSARDADGVTHRIWAVPDAGFIAAVTALVAASPVLIADGHHRYETACTYLAEAPESPGSAAILALLVELDERELAIRAIHRLISGVSGDELTAHLEASFEMAAGPLDAGQLRSQMGASGSLGLLTADRAFLLSPRGALVERAASDLGSALVAAALEGLAGATVGYEPSLEAAAGAAARGEVAGAILLEPASAEQVASTARGGAPMPPKTTYFHPKPRTGMVFRELDATG